ncbi:MAG: hypothetical protein ABSE77_13950 [Acidimicrobiales bacterium]
MPNCAHGFPEGDCLICRTLGAAPGTGKATKTKVAAQPELGTLLAPTRAGQMVATRDQSPEPVRQPDAKNRRAGKRRLFWPVVAAIVVGAVAVWVFAGIFLFALHIAEYVALALVAGWAGYRIGRARGRRGS